MTTQSNEKIVKDATNYVWGRLKVIFLMIFLLVIVKNHPGWDAFFFIILILQAVLAVIYVLKVPEKISEESRKRYEKGQQDFRQKWGSYSGGSYSGGSYSGGSYQRQQISYSLELTNSAQILGINIRTDSSNDIKKQYRKLAMKWHPDRFAKDTKENQEIANKNFQKLNNAYIVIKKYKNFN